MKSIILHFFALILLFASSLTAKSISEPEEAELLRQEIRKQEVVLQALKEKLHRIEEEDAGLFEISVSESGVQAGGKPVSPQELEAKLKTLPASTQIMIRAESTVTYEKVASIMKLCAKADLTDVVFATTQAQQAASGQGR